MAIKKKATKKAVTKKAKSVTPEVEDKKVVSPDKVTENKEKVSKETYTTEKEDEALQKHADGVVEEQSKVSTEKMESAIALLEEQFDLKGKGYSVNSFSDSNTNCTVKVSNDDFDLTIKVKDCEKFGLL